MIHDCLQLASVLLLLLGVVLSIFGTYYITHLYHAFRFGDLLSAAWRAAWQIALFRHKRLHNEAKVDASLGKIDPEDRGKSLIGIYLIFLGFVLQGVGTALGLVDILLGWGAKPS